MSRPARRLAPSTEPFPIKVVDDYRSLRKVLSERARHLGLSRLVLDERTGLPHGYSGKILGPAEVRKLNHLSLGLMLSALQLKLVAVPDGHAGA